jgi:hypothetical protein
VVEFFLPECEACETASVPLNQVAKTMMRKHHNIAFGRVNGDPAVQTTGPPSREQYEKGIEPGMVFGDAKGTVGGAPIATEWSVCTELNLSAVLSPGHCSVQVQGPKVSLCGAISVRQAQP